MRNLIVIATLTLTTSFAFAQNETVIYSFQGGNDGAVPTAGLVADKAGNLYGTTSVGGGSVNCESGCGTVFELSPPSAPGGAWTEKILHAFQETDGAYPSAALIFDLAGNLYGSTASGGIASCPPLYGCGTVFELSPPSAPGGDWTEISIYSFQGGSDGANPHAGLIFDQAGNLYGTTSAGGTNNCGEFGCGTVFELLHPTVPGSSWTETVLYAFKALNHFDGFEPLASLIFDQQGNLYGTTAVGGSADGGTVFELTPPSVQGNPWTETLLHAFGGDPDGEIPVASLISDQKGNLYGSTSEGGAGCYGCGTVFELTPPSVQGNPWTETVLASFGQPYGTGPAAAVILDDLGNLLGTTQYGGPSGYGTVFQLTPPAQPGGAWTLTSLYSFPGGTAGDEPVAPLLMGEGGVFYGTIQYDGVYSLTRSSIAQFSPASLDFGNQTVNFGSSPQRLTLTDTGNETLTITNIQITGYDAGDFAQQNNCAKSLRPGQSCQFRVTFTPSEAGALNAAITITDNAPNSPQSVKLTGVGVLPAVTFNPPSLSFPAQLIYTESKPQKVTLTNNGLGILAISNISLTGGSFRQTNTCGDNQIAPGSSCTFSVTFLPTLRGIATGSVSVTDNAPASPQSFSLKGEGTVMDIRPSSLNFGTQPLNTTSLPLTVTVSNKGGQPVTIQKIGFAGPAAADFSQTNTCPATLTQGASCFINVTFTPSKRGYRKAVLGIRDTGGGSPQEVGLEGYGTQN